MNTPRLHSIIMPAYNEEAVIAATVSALCGHLDATNLQYELIIVDDASSDNTAGIVAELAKSYPTVRTLTNPGPNGYGHAIRQGLDAYSGDDVVIVTSDGSDAPADVEAYFRLIGEQADCVFGSRFDGRASVEGYPPLKRVMNRVANTLIGWITRSNYRDFTNGFKCYRRHVIDDLQPFASGQFNITIEMSVGAVLAGHSFEVIPTHWRQRDGGQTSFRILKLIGPYSATLIYCLCRNYLSKVRR